MLFRIGRRKQIFFLIPRCFVDSQSNAETTFNQAVAQQWFCRFGDLSNLFVARFLLETGQTCEVTARGQR